MQSYDFLRDDFYLFSGFYVWAAGYLVTHFGEFVENHKDCVVVSLILDTFG